MTSTANHSCNPAAQTLEGFMASSVSSLAPLAARMAIPASALVALPVSIEVFASKAGMSEDAMISECLANPALRTYLEEICIQAEAAL